MDLGLALAPAHVGFFVLIGVAGALGHFMLIKALEIERASVLSPLGYAQLIPVKGEG